MAPTVVLLTAFFIAAAAEPVVPHLHRDRPAAQPFYARASAPSDTAPTQEPKPKVTWFERLRRLREPT
jgi:hypothetical protein